MTTTKKPEAGPIEDLLALMRDLREPGTGCPWDLEQNFATIAPYTVEEAYEVADAIEKKDMEALQDELGDLLFQVVFHAHMAAEAKAFTFADVVAGAIAKMTRRHPHVFGDARIESAAAQTEAWEKHKAAERARRGQAGASVLDGLPIALPALTRAAKLQERFRRVGFDWAMISCVLDKLRDELGELEHEIHGPSPSRARVADELGDVLFVCANLGHFFGVDPETALNGTNAKAERRFRGVEAALAARALTPEEASFEEMDRLWTDIKKKEKLEEPASLSSAEGTRH